MLKFALIGLLLLSAEPQRISIQTPGRFAFAPADWWVRVKVEPHAENRWLEVSVDGPSHYRATGFDLEGDKAPKIHQWWIKALPPGCYTFTAILRATGEHGRILARATGQKLAVVGMGDDDPCGFSADVR